MNQENNQIKTVNSHFFSEKCAKNEIFKFDLCQKFLTHFWKNAKNSKKCAKKVEQCDSNFSKMAQLEALIYKGLRVFVPKMTKKLLFTLYLKNIKF